MRETGGASRARRRWTSLLPGTACLDFGRGERGWGRSLLLLHLSYLCQLYSFFSGVLPGQRAGTGSLWQITGFLLPKPPVPHLPKRTYSRRARVCTETARVLR